MSFLSWGIWVTIGVGAVVAVIGVRWALADYLLDRFG